MPFRRERDVAPRISDGKTALVVTVIVFCVVILGLVLLPACLNGHGEFVWPPRFLG